MHALREMQSFTFSRTSEQEDDMGEPAKSLQPEYKMMLAILFYTFHAAARQPPPRTHAWPGDCIAPGDGQSCIAPGSGQATARAAAADPQETRQGCARQ